VLHRGAFEFDDEFEFDAVTTAEFDPVLRGEGLVRGDRDKD
jgi:hypothetical protein